MLIEHRMRTALALLVKGLVPALLLAGSAQAEKYVLLGWNDLGMHCANGDFSSFVVLPPYNNVRAQLVYSQEGSLPQLVTEGVRIDYSIPGNTTSVTKTNFWDYAQQIFDLPAPLPPDVGLTGNGLTGSMEALDGFFEVTGVPITPFQDDDLVNEQPFQLIRLEARRESDNFLLAMTEVVIPVSNEIGCVSSGCHSSEQSILNHHDDEAGFDPNDTPILCARCHSSNALGTPGIPEARSLSYRLHEKHKDIRPTNSIATCYKCHPGNQAQCLRGVMATGIDEPMICQSCHGTMRDVAESISEGRRPWLDEPSCGASNCHGSNYAEQPNTLFRMSTGHGGLYCSACHGSPHAILPSSEENDNLQVISLQGHAGTLAQCTVCHTDIPLGNGPHGSPAPAAAVADLQIVRLAGNQAHLSWSPVQGVSSYLVYSMPSADARPAQWTLLGDQAATEYDDLIGTPDEERFYRVVCVSH